jgi:steroid 5-alpha reductase family enzyme
MVRRGGKNPALRIFLTVYLVQAVVLWFVSLPVQFAQYNSEFGVAAWVGVAVWLTGFAFEAIGDACLWWGLYLRVHPTATEIACARCNRALCL